MEFFVFILLLSVVAFSVAFLAYAFCLRFFGSASVPKYILIPLAVVGWEFLVITRQGLMRTVLAALPVFAIAGLIVYAKIKERGSAPTPLELARNQGRGPVSAKSRKAEEKHRKRQQRQEAEKNWQERKKKK